MNIRPACLMSIRILKYRPPRRLSRGLLAESWESGKRWVESCIWPITTTPLGQENDIALAKLKVASNIRIMQELKPVNGMNDLCRRRKARVE